MSTISSRLVVASTPGVSHLTPLIGLCTTLLVRYPNLAITFFTHSNVVDHVESELAAQIRSANGAQVEERFRVFVFGDKLPTIEECGGSLVDMLIIPGLSPIYAYELATHPLFPGVARYLLKTQELYLQTQGSIFLSTRTLEPEAVPHFQSLRPDAHLITYLPRIVPAFVDESQPADSPAVIGRTQVLKFLEGKPTNSVLYISFGSQFHPTIFGPDYFRALVETLLEDEQPWSFVMTKGSKMATIPDDLVKRIEQSKKGILVGWAPQKEILAHIAVGLMLTHAGTGGAFESITASVPLLTWPMGADQVSVTQILTAHGVALELAQVRVGRAVNDSLVHGKIYGTAEAVKVELRDKLGRFHGEKGAGFRAKAKVLSEHLLAAKEPGGEVHGSLGEFERYM